MKLLRFFIICAPTCFLAGCIFLVHQSRPYYHHELALSMKDGVPCFSIENNGDVTNTNAHIQFISVGQKTNPIPIWEYHWKDAFTLASGECVQYGTGAGRARDVWSPNDCRHFKQNLPEKPFVWLPSGECFIDYHAATLEKGVVYFVEFIAYHKKNEDHSFSSYFCLSENKKGETIIHRLNSDRQKTTVETCPSVK